MDDAAPSPSLRCGDVGHLPFRLALGYGPTRSLEMARAHGGFETAHRLFATHTVENGLGELFLLGPLDLTLEHHDLLPEYEPLFSDHERAVARDRLRIRSSEEASR